MVLESQTYYQLTCCAVSGLNCFMSLALVHEQLGLDKSKSVRDVLLDALFVIFT